ncbi:MAG TPA: hypothetical protein VIM32_03920 [Desulfosporosinus sp.]|jgi:hypothetical protein|nr:hypothetical protein [Desulfosporosinus sp.]
MMQGLLGRDWNEVKLELENMGKTYNFQISRPHGKMEASGSCRVVRVREFDDRVEIVLVYEKFSPRQS